MIKITEAPEPTLPKTKQVIIGDVASGEIKPNISDRKMWWHACIKPHARFSMSCCSFLLQGHGATPEEAVAQAIVDTRKACKLMQESLAQIESELGTAGKTDDEVLRIGRGGVA